MQGAGLRPNQSGQLPEDPGRKPHEGFGEEDGAQEGRGEGELAIDRVAEGMFEGAMLPEIPSALATRVPPEASKPRMIETGETEHAGHTHGSNRFAVLSTPERFDDDGRLTGRGVTIAFLDSGFHPHPDLTAPEHRILAYHDVFEPGAVLDPDRDPEPDAWHGTQTSVVAAGSGHLSDGLYRGLASGSRLALVRVGRNGRIGEDAIARGLEWVLAHREQFGIRVLSLSLGGDEDRPLAENRVNRLVEEAVARG